MTTAAAIASPALNTIPAALGAAYGGGVYAGIARGLNGEPDYHLALLDGEAEGVTWQAAVDFAISIGGELPTRREQHLLVANLKDQFQPKYYWSSEQYAANPTVAWTQDFDNGDQNLNLKSYAGRARAVRRFVIQ